MDSFAIVLIGCFAFGLIGGGLVILGVMLAAWLADF